MLSALWAIHTQPQRLAASSPYPVTIATASFASAVRASGHRGAVLTRTHAATALPLASVTASLSAAPWGHYGERGSEALLYVQYKFMQALTLPTWGKLLGVSALTAPLVLAAGAALRALTGGGLRAALLRTYYILNNVPGVDVINEDDPRALALANAVYVLGLISFAVLIGLMGDDIGEAVRAARYGNTPVPERGHTLVLGANRQLGQVLRQVAAARADRGSSAFPGALVVLSGTPREELEPALAEALGREAAAGVVTRQGRPDKVTDLQRVSAGRAATVVVLSPDSEEEGEEGAGAAPAEEGAVGLTPEGRQAVTLAALQHARRLAAGAPHRALSPSSSSSHLPPQTVVVQEDTALGLMREARLLGAPAAGGVGASGGAGTQVVAAVCRLHNLSRIEAQCAVQPGLSAVLASLMQHMPGDPDFYIQHIPGTVGLTYGQARRLFPRAVPCGVHLPAAAAPTPSEAAGPALRLNPPDDLRLPPAASLVFLAGGARDLKPDAAALAAAHREAAVAAAATAVADAVVSPSGQRVGFFRWALGHGGGGGAAAGSESGAPSAPDAAAAAAAAPRPLRVAVLSFDGVSHGSLLEALADFCPPGSEAVVVRPADGGEEAAAGPWRRRRARRRAVLHAGAEGAAGGLAVQEVYGDPRVRATLAGAGCVGADAVLLAGLDPSSSDSADAQALATLMQLLATMPPAQPGTGPDAAAAAAAAAPRAPLHLVCRVCDPVTRQVMQALAAGRGVSLDLLNPDEMTAGVLTQVAAEPRLAELFEELGSVAGQEVYLRAPGDLLGARGAGQVELTWAEVHEAGRRRGETVLGTVRGGASYGDAGDSGGGGGLFGWGRGSRTAGKAGGGGGNGLLELGAAGHGAVVRLGPGDKLVVIAEQ